MTSARWWEYEDSAQYNARVAASWARDARSKGFQQVIGQRAARAGAQPEDWGGRSSFLDKKYFDKQTLDSIIPAQPRKPKPGGVLKAFDDLTSPIFGGELRQPWDLLRPVQRGLEAYDKAVVRPLARAALSPLPGTYEEQPGWLKFGAELLVDPLNYVPVGGLLKAGRLTARGATGLRAAGNAMSGTGSKKAVARFIGESVGQTLAFGAGAQAAEELGAPPIVGGFAGAALSGKAISRVTRPRPPEGPVLYMINPVDRMVEHGSSSEFSGLPDPAMAGKHYGDVSIPDSTYWTTARPVAEFMGGSRVNDQGQWVKTGLRRAVLKKGAKIWNPQVDRFPTAAELNADPKLMQQVEESWRNTARYSEPKGMPELAQGEVAFMDTVHLYGRDAGDPGFRNRFVDHLKKQGYQVIQTGSEHVVLDQKALTEVPAGTGVWIGGDFPLMSRIAEGDDFARQVEQIQQGLQGEERLGPNYGLSFEALERVERGRNRPLESGAIRKRVDVDAVARGIQRQRARDVKTLKALPDEELLEEFRENRAFLEMREEQLDAFSRGLDLPEKEFYENPRTGEIFGVGEQKFGPTAQEDMIQWRGDIANRLEYERILTNELQSRPTLFKPPVGGGSADPQSLVDFMTKLAGSGNPLFNNIASYGEVLYDGTRKRSLSKSGRAFIKDHVPNLVPLIEKRGIRLKDLDLHHVVDFWGEQVQTAREYGSKQGDLVRAALRRVPTKEVPGIGTIITDQDLINQAKGLNLLNPAGHLDLETVMQYPERFRIKPEYEAAFKVIDDLIDQQEGFEKALELEGLLDPVTKGFKHHQQALRRNDIPLGPVTIRRPGSKAPNRQGADFESKLEGVRNGVEYLPFVDAQSARFANGMKQFVDQWLEHAISDIGLTAAERVDPGLQADIAKALKIKQHSENLTSELQRAVDNPQAWRPPNFKDPSPEVAAIIDMGNLATQQVDQASQIEFFKAAQVRNRQLRDNITTEWQRLRSERKAFVDSFKDRASNTRQQFPVEYRGKYFPADIGAEALAELDRFKEPDGVVKWLDDVNNSARFAMSGLDFSFLGVNGLIAAFTDWPSFWKAAKNAFSSEGYADHVTRLQGSGVLDSMVKDGVHWAARSDLSELLQSGGPTPRVIHELRGPLATAYNASNTWFTRFGNVLRSSMYESALTDVTDPAARKELARTLNLITGFTPGDPSSIERAALYAPRFFRAQLGLLSDAVTKGNMGREGAARYLSQFLAEGMMLTYAMKEGLDLAGVEQPDWDIWDPTDPNYFRLRIGGRDISLFGTWDTLFRAVATGVADGPEAAAEYMVRSKASPAVGQLLNVISGETLGGSELSWSSPEELIKSMGELGFALSPIGLQSAYEGGIPRNLTEAGGAVISFMGTKATPMSPSERNLVLRNEVAREKYNKDWDQLEPSQQQVLRQENDLEVESKTDLAKSFDRRQAISERFQTRQEQIDTQLPVGRDWIDAYHELRREQIGAYGQWAIENPTGAARMRSGKGVNAADTIRQEFFKIFDTADTESWTPEELSEALADFDSQLTPAQRAYIERNTGLRDTPRVREYKAAQRTLRPYWRIEDTIWDRFKGRLPDSSESQSLQQYTNQYIMKLQAQGVPDQLILKRIQDHPVFSQMKKAVDTLRIRYRQAHPDVDRELVKWYGYVPIRQQRAS